jgi:hypothetical protein
MGEVKTYNVSLCFSYTIRTDDVARTRRDYEFPTFPDLIDNDAVEFIDSSETWEEE